MWFEAMSRLKINLEESEVIPIGEVDLLEELACEIGCGVVRSLYARFFHPYLPYLIPRAWLVDLWEHRGEGGNWNFRFVRNLNDWELGCHGALPFFTSRTFSEKEQEDKVVWKVGAKGVFSVKGLYFVLETGGTTPFPLKIVWNPWIPSKVSFLTWRLVGEIFWLCISFKEGDGPCLNRCALCKVELEIMDHILLHCVKEKIIMAASVSPFLVFGGLFLR
ncbi:hypothetical protein CK203_108691 [Vitis vinifera]|uniref:Reverse transcriptase zinc-binding domain-containing protein n=1 Tax=Vitis vinifera TaxID=29760 RepID=A0A438BQ95_VITVI|nr:hypothetical protein CK203_108691 [Vitis vinifera]